MIRGALVVLTLAGNLAGQDGCSPGCTVIDARATSVSANATAVQARADLATADASDRATRAWRPSVTPSPEPTVTQPPPATDTPTPQPAPSATVTPAVAQPVAREVAATVAPAPQRPVAQPGASVLSQIPVTARVLIGLVTLMLAVLVMLAVVRAARRAL